jgi:hypothetical protein
MTGTVFELLMINQKIGTLNMVLLIDIVSYDKLWKETMDLQFFIPILLVMIVIL